MLEEAREPRMGAHPILAVIHRSSGCNRTLLTGETLQETLLIASRVWQIRLIGNALILIDLDKRQRERRIYEGAGARSSKLRKAQPVSGQYAQ